MRFIPKYTVCFAAFFLTALYSYAQVKDSTSKHLHKNNIFNFAVNAIKKSHADSATLATVINTKSETPFLPYEGKGIRHIIIKEFGFDKTFEDTSKHVEYFGTKLLNHLHRNTREWVIRSNLFIKEKTKLNAYLVADNERYLRSLEFIQDARIVVNSVPDEPDSVDVIVISKDLFSLTGELDELNANYFKAKIGDANVLGMGQKLQFTALTEGTRTPHFGYEALYKKINLANTFINVNLDYTKINPDIRDGSEDESAWYFQLERPLVSQYSHFAGAIKIGNNETHNTYQKADTLFYHYNYNTYDAWLGYNLGVNHFLNNIRMQDRKFISIRYFKNDFLQIPFQAKDEYNFRYNSKQAVLAQFTFFRQDFYKTNYIYGFGTTEDVPDGYNLAFTGGWYQQSDLKRLYAGVDANRYAVSSRGDFFQYFLRAGTFEQHSQLQDASVLLGTGLYSRLFIINNLKIRQYMGFSYTRLFNRIGLDPLSINNTFGLRYFNSDSVLGDQRISLHSETFFFLKYKLFGFKFAPFAFGDASLMNPEGRDFSKSSVYYGLGGGVRMRNENLVFQTIEFRFIYFPVKVPDNNSFKITINSNINFRYNSNYVKEPDIIQLNYNDGSVY